MNVSYHPDALAELESAIAYYDECQPGLGIEFAEEVFAAITRIVEYPEAGIGLSPRTRRSLISRFPYGIVYQMHQGEIRILAVTHLHRRPGYWRERLSEIERG